MEKNNNNNNNDKNKNEKKRNILILDFYKHTLFTISQDHKQILKHPEKNQSLTLQKIV